MLPTQHAAKGMLPKLPLWNNSRLKSSCIELHRVTSSCTSYVESSRVEEVLITIRVELSRVKEVLIAIRVELTRNSRKNFDSSSSWGYNSTRLDIWESLSTILEVCFQIVLSRCPGQEEVGARFTSVNVGFPFCFWIPVHLAGQVSNRRS